MKVKLYALISDCIQRGIDIGYDKAFERTDGNPSEFFVKENIYHEVMNCLGEFIDIDDEISS
jgi:hypothetical protein